MISVLKIGSSLYVYAQIICLSTLLIMIAQYQDFALGMERERMTTTVPEQEKSSKVVVTYFKSTSSFFST